MWEPQAVALPASISPSPPPSIAQLPDSLPIAIEPTNKTDKTSEIRKVARLLGGSVPDEISKVGKRLSLCLSGCLSVWLSRQRLVKHQCVCPFGSVHSHDHHACWFLWQAASAETTSCLLKCISLAKSWAEGGWLLDCWIEGMRMYCAGLLFNRH